MEPELILLTKCNHVNGELSNYKTILIGIKTFEMTYN